MRKLLLAALLLVASPFAAMAQNTTGLVVSVCGTPPSPFVAGRPAPFTVDVNGNLCTGASSGGGAVTIADGADVTQGAKADAAYAGGGGSASVVAALKGIYAVGAAATPPGANIIGKVGIDQTTPGTTNGVQVIGYTGNTGALTNRSGTIATGGTAQTLAAINATRKYLFVENPCAATESLWINFTTAAVVSQPSIEIAACGSFLMQTPGFVSTELVSVIATTSTHAFIAKEF